MTETPALILDFSSVDRWMPVHDRVMGGVSDGSFRAGEETGVFSGTLSLENNGGFASIRFANPTPDLSRYEGVRLRVRGDGRSYQLRMRPDRGFDGIAWRAEFTTRDGEWQDVEIGFDEFRPGFRGRAVPEAGALPRGEVHQISVMIADKNPGDFRLELDWLEGIERAH